jgi:hypothetical protein
MMFNLINKSLISFFIASSLGASNSWSQYCDPELPLQHPNSQYIDHGDGTVTDKRTNLMWQKCLLGTSGLSCTGTSQLLDWKNAQLSAVAANHQSLLGYTDWRLPNIKELMSLTERSCENPSMNMTVFTNQTGSGGVWSSSIHSESTETEDYYQNKALALGFEIGELKITSKTGTEPSETHAIRLVRTIPE